MLGVYDRNGHFKEVVRLYKELLTEGIKPDGVAFVTLVSTCGHTGQVNLWIEYFESMVSDFGLDPTSEHYSCLYDLLCRAGELEKAWKVVMRCQIKQMAVARFPYGDPCLEPATKVGRSI
ncbi:hypothetical protein RHSIM_Rhsim05G0066200 [Rhododendron simsii]|uniref:Pentatricopeptide repeat-containing protein n=1 Tax=Rhododendron simsii TaxID=118357 RepID=A0A834GZ99_RHOSS|nr:hypothetical protein RHSIM_Rhsim05G0066200 [Rhododendron simsii]